MVLSEEREEKQQGAMVRWQIGMQFLDEVVRIEGTTGGMGYSIGKMIGLAVLKALDDWRKNTW